MTFDLCLKGSTGYKDATPLIDQDMVGQLSLKLWQRPCDSNSVSASSFTTSLGISLRMQGKLSLH